SRLPQRQTLARCVDGTALDRSRDAGGYQGVPTIEGSQAASAATRRSQCPPHQTRRSGGAWTQCHCRIASQTSNAPAPFATAFGTSPMIETIRILPKRAHGVGSECMRIGIVRIEFESLLQLIC